MLSTLDAVVRMPNLAAAKKVDVESEAHISPELGCRVVSDHHEYDATDSEIWRLTSAKK